VLQPAPRSGPKRAVGSESDTELFEVRTQKLAVPSKCSLLICGSSESPNGIQRLSANDGSCARESASDLANSVGFQVMHAKRAERPSLSDRNHEIDRGQSVAEWSLDDRRRQSEARDSSVFRHMSRLRHAAVTTSSIDAFSGSCIAAKAARV